MIGGDICRKFFKAMRLIMIPLYRSALFRGVAATIEHTQVLNHMKEQGVDLVVDIGANVGQFSLAVRNCIPSAKLIAFEPLAEPASRFRSVLGGDRNVRFVQCAIGPTTGKAEMHISKAVDSSSLLPINTRQSELFPGTEESHVAYIQVAPLDEFLKDQQIYENALLKIDVQGYELETLKGCESLLNMFAYLYVECSFIELYQGQALAHDVIAWLHERGFSLSCIGHITYNRDGISIQGDFLFQSNAMI